MNQEQMLAVQQRPEGANASNSLLRITVYPWGAEFDLVEKEVTE